MDASKVGWGVYVWEAFSFLMVGLDVNGKP
jgi:hypothetical protein